MKKKRYLKTFVCLILGAVLLSGSAFANYENASGYTKLKNGMLNMMTVENFSADAKFTLNYNGNELTSQQVAYQYDRSGSTSEYTKSFGSDGSGETWIQDGFNISHCSADIYNYTVYNAYSKGFNDSYLTGTEEERSMTDKTVNFAELLCDTLVGDLKNNFVLVSAENGSSTYQINLSKEQIPELIQSGLSLIFGNSYSNYGYITYENVSDENVSDEEETSRFEKAFEVYQEHDSQGVVYVREDGTIEYYATESEYFQATGNVPSLNSLYSVFDSDPSISGVSCTVTLDSEGRLSYLKATGSLTGKDADGNEQDMTLDLEISIYDYGTTSIKAFDKSLLNFDWNTTGDGYRYYQFDSEGNIVQYDSYQYDEYGNLISEDKGADVELIDPATDDESAA